MRPSEAVATHRQALLEIAQRYGVTNVRIFGSVARGEDFEDSDVDLLVDGSVQTSLFDLASIEVEATRLTGVSFDVCTPGCLSKVVLKRVLADARPL